MFRKIMTAAEAQKKAEVQQKKRLLKLIEEEKRDVYKRIVNSVNRGDDYYRYTAIGSPNGELYPEVKAWLISLGYQVEDYYEGADWKISWQK